jgi:phage-related tail protein
VTCCGRCKVCNHEWAEIESQRDAAVARAEKAEDAARDEWHRAQERAAAADRAWYQVNKDLDEALKLLREVPSYFSTYNRRTDSCDDCGQRSWETPGHTDNCIVTRYKAFLEKHK